MGRQQKGSGCETALGSITSETCKKEVLCHEEHLYVQKHVHVWKHRQQYRGLIQVLRRVLLHTFGDCSSSEKLLGTYRKGKQVVFSLLVMLLCLCKGQLYEQLLNITLSSMMVATSGRPWTTLARPGNEQIWPFSFTYRRTTWLVSQREGN